MCMERFHVHVFVFVLADIMIKCLCFEPVCLSAPFNYFLQTHPEICITNRMKATRGRRALSQAAELYAKHELQLTEHKVSN